MKYLVLRPAVGAAATAARIAAAGHDAIVAPLFTYRALAWDAPDAGDFDAVMLTSAAAVRLGGAGLARYRQLPTHGVGAATAAAARTAGFEQVIAHAGDAKAVLDALAAAGVRRVLHPAGLDHVAIDRARIALTRIQVYAADAVAELPDAVVSGIAGGAIVLLHSPRAAALLRARIDAPTRAAARIACFSAAVAAQAGDGWRGIVVADMPTDDALLAAAARLCDQGSATREPA